MTRTRAAGVRLASCDDGNSASGDGGPADCRQPCGDTVRDPDEACDGGNTVSRDGCSADCRVIEVCPGDRGCSMGAP